MNWLAAFFAWLLRLPRTARLAAMARTYLSGVLQDLDNNPAGSLDPETEHRMRRNCGALLFTAQTLLAAFILCRAREIAGLKVVRPHMDFHATPRRLSSRDTLRKRATELLRRLDRAEQHARRLAKQLAAAELEELMGALSTRLPRAGGHPDSARSALVFRRLLFALTREAGSPPAQATRLTDCAPRDGPALATIPIRHPLLATRYSLIPSASLPPHAR